jgi:hypothetical protein
MDHGLPEIKKPETYEAGEAFIVTAAQVSLKSSYEVQP